jgi:hypothetical protein
MTTRKDRLKKLVHVQEQLKAFHEMRYASYRAEASAAESEANQLKQRFDEASAMSALFPEIYYKRIERALERAAKNLTLADKEAGQVAAATARTNMVERAYRDVKREEERVRGDRERLEAITRGMGKKKDGQ